MAFITEVGELVLQLAAGQLEQRERCLLYAASFYMERYGRRKKAINSRLRTLYIAGEPAFVRVEDLPVPEESDDEELSTPEKGGTPYGREKQKSPREIVRSEVARGDIGGT